MRSLHVIAVATLLATFVSQSRAASETTTAAVQAAVSVRQDIDAALATGTLHLQAKNFGWASPGCVINGYPVLSRSIARDRDGRITLYDRSQIVSHGATERIRSYFDKKGQLRVVERRLAETVDLVRVSTSGQIVSSQVSVNRGASWRDSSTDFNDWYMKPRTPEQVEAEFSKPEPTCEQSAG